MANEQRLTDAEILAQIPAARRRAQEAEETEVRAVAAHYDRDTGRVVLALTNGCIFEFPAARAQGLRGASPEELEQVEVYPGGGGLRWDALDVDLSVPGLVAGIFGGKAWMRALRAELGREGGSATSQAKSRAARENGRKGGRPRKAAG